jgi:adenylyltransferase/sulfurtransferase
MLTHMQKNRYARQIMLKGVGESGQEKLRQARVLIVGVGGLGCPLALYLCAAGIGSLGLIDDDLVAESNLQRQILYATPDVGRPKVEVASARLQKLNPEVAITAWNQRLSPENAAEIIGVHDIVVDGCDNFATRYLINDTCVSLGKVYVYGAISGWSGQVSLFNYRNGPTYRCLFPEERPIEEVQGAMGVMGALPGQVATLQAAEVFKIVCGVGTPLSGVVLLIDLLTGSFETIALARQVDKEAKH